MLFNQIKEYLLDKRNFNELERIVDLLNNYDGSCEDYICYKNDQQFFDDFFYGRKQEIKNSLDKYNYSRNDEYVGFDGFGRYLISMDKEEYYYRLTRNIDEIVEKLLDIKHIINFNKFKGLKNILD